ncbi:anther-specific proline-rich protein APG-like [Huso huso]|uniref:Anther-specific proline-rich protein APG-like n=1 Tax=Huso huso TaxID=61971 RepID=A0ABR1A9C2_HUSHU
MSFVSDTLYKSYIRPNMPRYVDKVKVNQVLMYITCLTDNDKEEINAKLSSSGNSIAMQMFFDCLKRRQNWPSEFIEALKNVSQDDLASELEREYSRLKYPQRGSPAPAPQQPPAPSVPDAPPAGAPPLCSSPPHSAPMSPPPSTTNQPLIRLEAAVYTHGNNNNPAAAPVAATPPALPQNPSEPHACVLPSSQSPFPPPSPVSNASVQTSLPANLLQGATSYSHGSHAISVSEPEVAPAPSSILSSPEGNSRRDQVEVKTSVQETASPHTNYKTVPRATGPPNSNSDTKRNQIDANHQLTGTPQENRIRRSVDSSGRPSAGPGHTEAIPSIRGATAGSGTEEYLSKPGMLTLTNTDDQPCSVTSSQLQISSGVTESPSMSGVRQVPETLMRGTPPSGAEDDCCPSHDTSASSPCYSAVPNGPFNFEEYNKEQKIQALSGYQNPNLMESLVAVDNPLQIQHDTFPKLAQSPETIGACGPSENSTINRGEHRERKQRSPIEPWRSLGSEEIRSPNIPKSYSSPTDQHLSTNGRETTEGTPSCSDVKQIVVQFSQNPSIDDHASNQFIGLREESPQSGRSWSDLERPQTSSHPREWENLGSVTLQSPENNQREPRGDARRQFDGYLVPAIAIAALSVAAVLLWRYMKK